MRSIEFWEEFHECTRIDAFDSASWTMRKAGDLNGQTWELLKSASVAEVDLEDDILDCFRRDKPELYQWLMKRKAAKSK